MNKRTPRTKVATAGSIGTLSNFLERYEIDMTVKEGTKPPWQTGQKHYRITLNWATVQTFDYWTNGEPKLSDVLSCLVSDCHVRDNCRDVLDFVSEYRSDAGLDDAAEIRKTWAALGKNRAKMRRLLGADYELVMQLENDR